MRGGITGHCYDIAQTKLNKQTGNRKRTFRQENVLFAFQHRIDSQYGAFFYHFSKGAA